MATRPSLMELAELGKTLGYAGEELKAYLQEIQREWRQEDRERRQEEIEREERERERERQERIRLAEIAAEKEREMRAHELRLRELDLQSQSTSSTAVNAQPSVSEAHSFGHPHLLGPMSFPFPQFNEREDRMDVFLEKFENVARSYLLDKEKWCLKLSLSLRGPSYECYSRLPPGQETNFEFLKNSLLKRYELTASAYRNKFRNAKREPGETISQFFSRIKSYLLKWQSLASFTQTYEDLEEMILAEQLKESMSKPLQTFLTENGAERIADILKLAERFDLAHPEQVGARAKMHLSKSPPKFTEKPTERNTHREPEFRNGRSNTPNTNNINHRYHPQENRRGEGRGQQSSEWRGRLYCKYCRLNTHNTADCRKKPPQLCAACLTNDKQENTRMNSHDGERPPVVDTILLNGKEESETLRLPLAKVNIDCKYVKGTIVAGCLPNPIFPVLLGCKYLYLAVPKTPMLVGAMDTR
ncbi:unnamed protein product, partial [Candidula unifasciata]